LGGDPHAAISAVAIGFLQFPLLFVSLDDGVFVTVAPDSYARALGAQLMAGGVPNRPGDAASGDADPASQPGGCATIR
jgi:hypothetical protein